MFVAAGFNPGSHSARLVEAVRDGRLRLVWDDATHAEIEHVMRQIPRLSWPRIADLFRSEDRFGGSTHPEAFGFVPDPADRKFAALAQAAHAPLVTSDAGLLNAAGQTQLPIYVVLTMRSDFIGDCIEYPGLPDAVNNGQYLVPRMTRDQVRLAITGPAVSRESRMNGRGGTKSTQAPVPVRHLPAISPES